MALQVGDVVYIEDLVTQTSEIYYQKMEEGPEDFEPFTEEQLELLVVALEPEYTRGEMIKRIIELGQDWSLFLQNKK